MNHAFGLLSEERLALLAVTLIVVGIQIFFSSFLLSILGLRRRAERIPSAACSRDCPRDRSAVRPHSRLPGARSLKLAADGWLNRRWHDRS
jgi:hypothetical protein